MKKGALAEADLPRMARVTPLILALIGAAVTVLAGALVTGGVVIAVLILLFGYIYVIAIELGRAIGLRLGWLVSSSAERL